MGTALALDGDVALVGVPNWKTQGIHGGRVLIYERDGAGVLQPAGELNTPWVATSSFQWNHPFGRAVAIDGNTAVVAGSPLVGPLTVVGSALVFERLPDGTWVQDQILSANDNTDFDEFGVSVAISGNRIVVGAPSAKLPVTGNSMGAVYAFERQGPGLPWIQVRKLFDLSLGSIDRFGQAVALERDVLAVGIPGDDRASAFIWNQWDEIDLTPIGSASNFGAAVAIRDSLIAVGATSGGTGNGAVHVFAPDGPDGSTWSEANRLTPLPVPGSSASVITFGQAIAMDSGLIAVGARGLVGSTATGGSVHLFHRDQDGPGALGGAAVAVPGSQQANNIGAAVALQGSTLLVGAPHTGVQALWGVGAAYQFDIDHQPVNYCTSGVSAAGCQAAIGANGTASASASSGFQLSATQVPGAQKGLFFIGVNGRQAAPWGAGTSFQCVAPPLQRMPGLVPGGSPGACDGNYLQDLNALWCHTCPYPFRNPGPGRLVQAQLWYQDPLSTSYPASGLSDAIEFLVTP